MSTALTIRAKPEELSRVETIVAEMSAAGGAGDSGHFGRAFRMAAAIRALHQAVTDEMMKDIMALQGSGLGFLTDKDKDGGYPVAEVKLVAIEAALMGAYWVGNEFNIISNRPYLTKNFFVRRLREFPGLTDLKLFPGVPVLMGDKGALVPYVATWRYNGQEMSIERLLTKLDDKRELDERICVKVNSGMGADAILGKAERKIRAAIHARLTGSDLTDGEVDDAGNQRKPVRGINDLAARLEGTTASATTDVTMGNGNGSGRASASGSAAGETHDRPATGDDVDTELIDDCRAALNAAYEDGKLSLVGKAEEQYRTKAKNEATRTAISGMCDETRQKIKNSPSVGKTQRELAGAK